MRQVASDVFTRFRDELRREREQWVCGLSPAAWRLIRVLRALEGAAAIDDVVIGYRALDGTETACASAVFELARAGLVEIGPAVDEDGGPASYGVISLRLDVNLPEAPPEAR